MLHAIVDNSHILIMLVARLGIFTFNRKFSYFIYMHQRMGNGAGSTDLTNFFLVMIFGAPYYCMLLHPGGDSPVQPTGWYLIGGKPGIFPVTGFYLPLI